MKAITRTVWILSRFGAAAAAGLVLFYFMLIVPAAAKTSGEA